MKDKRNLSLVMDFYELTMSQCYFNDNKDKEVVFDLFYRKNPDDGGYCVFAGLEQVVDYVSNLHFEKEDIDYLRSLNQFSEEFLEYLSTIRFTGDIYAIPEGTPVFPHEPLVRVKAPIIEAQLVETALLLAINHQTLIATKSRRIVQASEQRAVMEFGARRAHNFDAAILGARAAYIAGCAGSATTYSGKEFGVPVLGTMAHSFIQSFDTEYDAFMYYAKTYPNACTLLIDTYSTLKSGIVNAIKVAKDYLEPNGYRLKGVRIDSGDMAYLSKKVRKMLDEAGMKDCKIVVSNSLDEYVIESLIHQQGAKIDSFGVGENLICSKNSPVFGGVYKMVAIEKDGQVIPKIKISDNVEKEDVFNVAENLVINEKEEMIKTADFFNTWSEWVSSEEGSGGDMLTSVKDNKLPVHKVGDSIDMFGTGEDKNGNYIDNVKISVCADSVQIADDLQLLGENPIPQKWQDAVGADGKLITNTLSYVKLGDGVDTVDEVVKTGSVPQKLVYVTVTYTNQSEEEINHMLYLGSLMLLNHEDGRYFIQQDRSGNGFDCVIWDGAAQISDMTYFSVSEDYGNGGNYISSLKPGESVQVNMAWIVNESDLDDIYLNLSGDGVIYEFSDSVLTTGLVDIRK